MSNRPLGLLEKSFEAFCLIKAADEKNGELILSGPVASDKVDFDGEVLEKAGVMRGLDTHQKLGGEVDYDHMYPKTKDPSFIIGKAIERGWIDGLPWLSTRLYKSKPLAQKVWEHFKAGGRLGYSIFGTGVRNPSDPKRIVETTITWVTLAPQPKGFDQFMTEGRLPNSLMAVAKALTSEDDAGVEIAGVSPIWVPAPATLDAFHAKAMTTGSGIVEAGQTGASTLRKQFLQGSPESASYGDVSKDPEEAKKRKKKRRRAKLKKSMELALASKGFRHPDALAEIAVGQWHRGLS